MSRSWTWRAIALGAAAALALVACAGDDDDDVSGGGATPEAAGATDAEAFCDAVDDMGLSVSIGEGHEGVDAALAAAEEIAPEQVLADVTTMAEENRAQVAAGPPSEGAPTSLPSDEFFTAAAAVGDYMADNCGYPVIDVTATDHAFDGIPADVEGGKTLVRIANDGTEYHEVVLERVQQGETRSVEEILALPEQEEGDLLDYLGSAFAPPGSRNWTVVDLAAGRHVAMCFIPTGATTTEALQSGEADDTAESHAAQGMAADLQVS